MYLSTDTNSVSIEKITIFTEARTITPSTAPLVSKYHFDNTLHSIALQLKNLTNLGDQYLEESKRFINDLDNIKSETIHISKDTNDTK